MGDTEGNIIAQCYRFGEPLPERIKNAPKLILGLQLYFNAFFDLDTERSHAQGLTLIPRSAMVEYARELGLDSVAKSDLIYYVRQMDLANLEMLEEKRKIHTASQDNNGGSDGRS